jgi:hypothetical protein
VEVQTYWVTNAAGELISAALFSLLSYCSNNMPNKSPNIQIYLREINKNK